MTTVPTSDAVDTTDWPRPGPGTWVLDTEHTGPMPSRQARDLMSEAARAGFSEGFALLGAPLETMDVAFVNGRFYRRLVPAVGGHRDSRQPPAPVLWAAARLVPTFRRLERTAKGALRDRAWRSELDRWVSTWRPEITEANRRFGAVDPAALDDGELADHLGALWAHLRRSTALHFRLHASDLGPIGLLLAATDGWGLERDEVLGALTGASPATNGPATALGEVRALVHAALDREGGAMPTTLAGVRALGPEVADAVDGYVDTFGWRLTTGYDVTDRTLVELPELLVRSVTAPLDAPIPSGHTQHLVHDRGTTTLASLLERVPEDRRAEFDVLVDDARDCYGLRDENGPITYEWPAGLLRRALLETGARLAAPRSGGPRALRAPDHVFDATVDELVALLTGAPAPSAEEVEDRHAERLSWPALSPPPTLGPPEAQPPLWTLPPGMRTLMGATIAVMELVDPAMADSAAETSGPGQDVTGLGIGTDVYRGTARVVRDAPQALATVQPGDVLVTSRTVPTFNAVLTIVGAVVVEEGGLMSHAAVMARELGIAGVIGASGALTSIPDGATVEVDPAAGRVRVVS